MTQDERDTVAQQLREACAAGNVEAARALLAGGAAVDSRDAKGKTALFWAARRGAVAVMELLMDHGADLGAVSDTGKSVLHAAAKHGGVEAVHLLLERGHPVGVKDERERTVLLGAAHNGQVDSMRVLMEHGVDLEAVDDDEQTALHSAAAGGSVEAVKVLVENGVCVNAEGWDERTVLHVAAENGHADVVSFLVEHGAVVNAEGWNHKTALHLAAEEGHSEVVSILLKQGALVDAVGEDGNTALHFAAENGHAEVVVSLLKHGAEVDSKSEDGSTAFLLAAKGVHVDAMRALVERGADAHVHMKDGRSALHCAAEVGHAEAVEFLLEQNLSVTDVTEDGATVLKYAVTGGDVDILTRLIELGAEIQSTQKDGRTLLHSAAGSGRADVVEFLLDRGLDVNAINHNGTSILHYATIAADVRTIRVLLQRGADARAANKRGQTALHFAAQKGTLDVVSLLADVGVSVSSVDNKGLTPLHYAALRGDTSIIKLLLHRGADIHAITEEGRSALHCAVRNGHTETVSYLLDQGLPVDTIDKDGNSVFEYATWSDNFSVIKLLIDSGVDIHATLKDGRTLLHSVVESGTVEILSYLLDQGIAVETADKDGTTAFHLAVERGDIGIMELLIRYGAGTTTHMKNGQSVLHQAVKRGILEAVSCLVQHGHAVNAADEKNGTSVFHAAAEEGNVRIMEFLLKHGADAFTTTKIHQTALHIAAYMGHRDALQFLLDQGLAIDAADEDGSTPLHLACTERNAAAVRFLIERGADIHARRKDGRSALHVSAEYGNVEVAKLLIDKGIRIDESDEEGNTPLHKATLNGQLKMMKFLITQGADVHALTTVHKNILHLAVEAADVDALKYALEFGVDVNARAKIQDTWQTPLLTAFRRNNCKLASEMALALCSADAQFDEKDRLLALTFYDAAAGIAVDKPPTAGSDAELLSGSALWRFGLCLCVDRWIQEHRDGRSTYTKIPIEVIMRGEASVRTYLADVAGSVQDDKLHRCKICVVGPSEWGKTSLVQSLKSETTVLTQLKDRTVGIDLTTCELKSVADNNLNERLEITFWDFAGQDVYHAAHTLFFSKRTLFVLVIDLEAYWKELADAETKADGVFDAQMNRFVGAKIFRWVRSIFAHRPDAQFVVVGSKVDRLEDTRVVDDIWNDLRDRLDHWKTAFAKGLDAGLLPSRANVNDVKALQGKLSQLGSSDWVVTNITKVASIKAFRSAVHATITSSELGIPMWKTYTKVLEAVIRRREVAQRETSVRGRIEKSIIRFSTLRRLLLREIDGLEREACEQIVRTLGDLGDVLWYEHEDAGVFKDCIILDPKLVIDVVREVVRHDFSSDVDGKPPRDGRITHLQLSTFPLWKDMDMELMHAFKALLQHFQLAYPADEETMLPTSDIIVPTYWNADSVSTSQHMSKRKPLPRHKSVCDAFAVHRWCWEYEVPSELSETIFVQFAVQSHSSYLPRTIRGFCVEAACAEFATSISLIQHDSSRDVIRIEVSGVSAELSWHNMRFYLMKMEKVLEGYPGDAIWRSIVYRTVGTTSESRHPVGPLMKAVEDAIVMGKGTDAAREKMPWMPPDVDWFMRKSWNDIASFQQLRMNQLVQEKLEVLQKLAIAGDAPRQFPALWSLDYDPDTKMALLRMSSDLTGRCYHVPLEIDAGSPLLARHASVFKAGVSLFATVVGSAISLPIVQTTLNAAKSAFDNNADHAERVHNLIDKLNLSSDRFDSRTTSGLSPGASMVLLRDLLKAYDDSLDALEISEISNLECAVTSNGEYVWAHKHEISSMHGKITPCAAPPSTWKELQLSETSHESTNVLVNSPTSSPTATASRSSSLSGKSSNTTNGSSKTGFKISLSVVAVTGLSDWDWHKTYCKWQLYYRKSLSPLDVDVTPTNGDSSREPSWSSMRKTIDAVASVEMLRECRLAVQVKRRSRIGWTKLIGEGEVWLRDFVAEDSAQNFTSDSVHVPLDASNTLAVVLTLALEK